MEMPNPYSHFWSIVHLAGNEARYMFHEDRNTFTQYDSVLVVDEIGLQSPLQPPNVIVVFCCFSYFLLFSDCNVKCKIYVWIREQFSVLTDDHLISNKKLIVGKYQMSFLSFYKYLTFC